MKVCSMQGSESEPQQPQQPQQPLDILCQQALKLDARVRFRNPEVDRTLSIENDKLDDETTDQEEVFELEGLNTETTVIVECIADLLYERNLDARLEQAFFNKQRNTKRYAYGEFNVLENKRKHSKHAEHQKSAETQTEKPQGVCSDDTRGGRTA